MGIRRSRCGVRSLGDIDVYRNLVDGKLVDVTVAAEPSLDAG